MFKYLMAICHGGYDRLGRLEGRMWKRVEWMWKEKTLVRVLIRHDG